MFFTGDGVIRPPWNPPEEPTGEPAPLFTRDLSGGSTNVPATPPDYVPGEDYIPPGQIIDLKVTDTFYDEATVTLTWTATGDDLDYGSGTFMLI